MEIGVSYASITQLQDNCTQTVSKINSIVSNLDAQLAPLATSWTGDAYNAYKADQSKWDTASQDLTQVLNQIASALEASNGQYQKAESTNTQMFTGS